MGRNVLIFWEIFKKYFLKKYKEVGSRREYKIQNTKYKIKNTKT
jgi:hypothetical protein